MSAFRKLAAAAALALCALAPSAAMAAKVLFLSTAEWATTTEANAQCSAGGRGAGHFIFGKFQDDKWVGGTRLSDGAILSLQNQVGASNVLNYAGVLSPEDQIKQASLFNGSTTGYPDARNQWNAAMTALDGLGAGDVVVVQTGYQIMDSVKAKTLAEKIKAKKQLTFVLLLDTCQDCNYDGATCKIKTNTTNLDAIKKPAIDDYNGWELNK